MRLDELPDDPFYWARPLPIYWSDIEPDPGDRIWEAVSSLTEGELRYAADRGRENILIITSTPRWAQAIPGSFCGPIKPERLNDFTDFMKDMVHRYSGPPYHVKYWELWNEPDVDPSLSSTKDFGCWGDDDDPYYGGGRYAEMLKAIYPAVKAEDPEAQILVGGLLLNCDPRASGLCDDSFGGDLPPKFMEGILKNGGSDYFDGISFHTYDITLGEPGKYYSPNWGSSWDTTGPAMIAKAGYLRELLAKYGQSGKYLISTESAVTSYAAVCDSSCELTKAYYVPVIFTVAQSQFLAGNLWYCMRAGWRHTDLFGANKLPLPAYTAFQVAWGELHAAQFLKKLELGNSMAGFEFYSGDHLLWVVWAQDDAVHSLTVPGNLLSVTDPLGNTVPLADPNEAIQVALKPLYIRWIP